MFKKTLLIVALLALTVALPACGGKKVIKTQPVTGTVTLDGSPLADANVIFTPTGDGGSPASGKTDASGVYKLQTAQGAAGAGTTEGNYVVTVTCNKVVKEAERDSEGEVIREEETQNIVPAKYGDQKKSGLTATVVKGPNTYDIELTSK